MYAIRSYYGSVTLTFLNQVMNLRVTVLDQFGKTFAASVSWSSADPLVATVSSSGQVKAVKNGATTVTAAAGGLNISDEYASTADGGRNWRDTHVRIEGPVVTEP